MMKVQSPAAALAGLVESTTAKWAKQRKAEERNANARARRNDRLIRYYRPMSLREAAFRVMPQAFAKASDEGRLPANARQIYYAARPKILEMTGKERLDSQYFSQTLLIDYMQEYGVDWDVVWDDRGHFTEPHEGETLGLGTLAVRHYLRNNAAPVLKEAGFRDARVKTHGPAGRFGAVSLSRRKASRRSLRPRAWRKDSISRSCRAKACPSPRHECSRIAYVQNTISRF